MAASRPEDVAHDVKVCMAPRLAGTRDLSEDPCLQITTAFWLLNCLLSRCPDRWFLQRDLFFTDSRAAMQANRMTLGCPKLSPPVS
jgi:hypothetical protein